MRPPVTPEVDQFAMPTERSVATINRPAPAGTPRCSTPDKHNHHANEDLHLDAKSVSDLETHVNKPWCGTPRNELCCFENVNALISL